MRPTFATFGILLILASAAICQPCDAPRQPWMDSLKSNGIKVAVVWVDFDFFPNGHLAIHITDVHYYSEYGSANSEVRKENLFLPRGSQAELQTAATEAMQTPLRHSLAAKRVTQGRGRFSYPLYDDPCHQISFSEPIVYGPTPLTTRPVGKRFAVVTGVASTTTFGGKAEQQIKVVTDDGWLYTCDRFGRKPLPFRKGENVAVAESDGRLRLEALESNARKTTLRFVQKTRFGYL